MFVGRTSGIQLDGKAGLTVRISRSAGQDCHSNGVVAGCGFGTTKQFGRAGGVAT